VHGNRDVAKGTLRGILSQLLQVMDPQTAAEQAAMANVNMPPYLTLNKIIKV